MKILLLEDNQTLNDTISLKLKTHGHEVSSFTDGKDAYDAITDGFSCFILDINVPKIDGIEILKQIRKFYEDIPIIIISATIELDLIKKSYDFGCNDYLKKPFFLEELVIKIDKLCNIHDRKIKIDEDLYFDFSQNLLTVDGVDKKLTPKENLLLNILLKHKNQLVSYSTIENYVWEGNYVSIDSIRTLIRRLKKALIKPYIESYTNRGYTFKISMD